MSEPLSEHLKMSPPRLHVSRALRPKKSDAAAQIAAAVGTSLREIRRQQGHSLDTLARASGVSRAMLGQIETGKSVPTITLLWKVAEALGVPVAVLVSPSATPSYVIERKSSARTVSLNSGGFEVRSISPPAEQAGPSLSELRLSPKHRERFPGGDLAAQVSLVVVKGNIECAIGKAPPAQLSEGDAIFFSAGHEHWLANTGDGESILYLFVAPLRAKRG